MPARAYPCERARPARAATCGRRGARCARGCLAGSALGERLPWCAERGRILMGRPLALPPVRSAPSSHSFLQLSPSRPVPRLGPRTRLRGREPPPAPPCRPGAWGGREARGCGTPGGGQVKGCAGEGLGRCPAWARAPNGHGSWERRCCLGNRGGNPGRGENKGGI